LHKIACKPTGPHWQSWRTSARLPKLHFKSCHGNFDDSRWLPHRYLFSG